jgi:hypothetical protein
LVYARGLPVVGNSPVPTATGNATFLLPKPTDLLTCATSGVSKLEFTAAAAGVL